MGKRDDDIDWDDQECDLDCAPIRRYFDEVPMDREQLASGWGKGQYAPWVTMLIGDEIKVIRHHESSIRSYAKRTGKEFSFRDAGGLLYVYRDN